MSNNIKVINSQGVKLWLTPQPASPWVTCGQAIAALRAGSMVECPQSVGEVTETRSMVEYKCLSSNESAKSLGAVSRSSFDVEVILNPLDKSGQQLLRDNFRNNTPLIMGIEYSGVMLYFYVGVSAMGTSIQQDAAIITKFTIEISSDIHECSTKSLITHPVVNNGIIVTNNGVPVVNTH